MLYFSLASLGVNQRDAISQNQTRKLSITLENRCLEYSHLLATRLRLLEPEATPHLTYRCYLDGSPNHMNTVWRMNHLMGLCGLVGYAKAEWFVMQRTAWMLEVERGRYWEGGG